MNPKADIQYLRKDPDSASGFLCGVFVRSSIADSVVISLK